LFLFPTQIEKEICEKWHSKIHILWKDPITPLISQHVKFLAKLWTSKIKRSQAGVLPSKQAKLHCLLKPVMFWKFSLYKVQTFEYLLVSFIYTCLPPAFRTTTYIGLQLSLISQTGATRDLKQKKRQNKFQSFYMRTEIMPEELTKN
jgi:hypothetical protein